jgi:hypothetical protein
MTLHASSVLVGCVVRLPLPALPSTCTPAHSRHHIPVGGVGWGGVGWGVELMGGCTSTPLHQHCVCTTIGIVPYCCRSFCCCCSCCCCCEEAFPLWPLQHRRNHQWHSPAAPPPPSPHTSTERLLNLTQASTPLCTHQLRALASLLVPETLLCTYVTG